VLGDFGFNESVWCTVKLSEVKLLIGVCYRSPNSDDNNNKQLLALFDKAVGYALQNNDTRLMILGDFNCPEIDFVNYCVSGSTDSAAYNFFLRTHDLFLIQHVSEPTRVTKRHRPSLLDYVFTDEAHLVDNITHMAPLGKSDHVCLAWNIELPASNFLLHNWKNIQLSSTTGKGTMNR